MRLDDRVLLQLIVDQDSLNGKQQQRDNSLLTYTWTQCTSCWNYTASVFRKLYKSLLHRLWYRTSQIYRIVDKMNTECISSGSSQRALKDDVQLPITLEARRLLWTLYAALKLSDVLSTEFDALRVTCKLEGGKGTLETRQDAIYAISRSIGIKKAIRLTDHSALLQNIWRLHHLQLSVQQLVVSANEPVSQDKHHLLFDRIWNSVGQQLHTEEDKIKSRWILLGFQGSNPETDFRATGLFGLHQFHNFCINQPEVVTRFLVESNSTSVEAAANAPWYPVALTAIHLSYYILHLLRSDLLLYHIICTLKLDHINALSSVIDELYAQLFTKFHEYWMAQVNDGLVKSVLDFEHVFSRFKVLRTREFY